MKKIQQGFTLIELMIVVAIIGILAAIAIPAYTDYTARAQVSEAVSLMAGLKTPVAEYYHDKGSIPTLVQLGTTTTSGKYVGSIIFTAIATGLTITATMKATGVAKTIQSKTITLTFATATNQKNLYRQNIQLCLSGSFASIIATPLQLSGVAKEIENLIHIVVVKQCYFFFR